MRRIILHSAQVFCFVVLAIAGTGCDNTIDPLVESDFEAFAIHGYLDMRTSSQVVRVESLRATILAEPVSLEGVQVSSIELETGIHKIWRDSTVVLDSGSEGIVYVAHFRPTLGRSYRLIVSRGGSPGAEAIAQLPTQPSILVNSPVGDSLNMKQRIVLQGMTEEPNQVFMRYVVVPADDSGERTIRIAYGKPGAASVNGWEFDVDLATDRYIILNQLGLTITTNTVTVRGVSLEMTVFSDEWKDPDNEANLIQAHGFFGSVGVLEQGWLLDTNSLNTLGFIDGQ